MLTAETQRPCRTRANARISRIANIVQSTYYAVLVTVLNRVANGHLYRRVRVILHPEHRAKGWRCRSPELRELTSRIHLRGRAGDFVGDDLDPCPNRRVTKFAQRG